MEYRLRQARPDDAPTIHRLICDLATYEREPDAVQASPRELREQLEAEPRPFECILAEHPDGDAIGFALYFFNYSTWRGRAGLYLEDLFVEPPARGAGIGKALLTALARIAVQRGCARMEWSVLDWNTPAIEFYRSLGAESMDEWTTFRLSDAALKDVAAKGPLVEGFDAVPEG